MKVSIDIPDCIALVLRGTEKELQDTIKLSLAVKLYEDRKLSLGEAALLADANKIEFMEYLNKSGISTMNYNNEDIIAELAQDLENARLAVNINE